MESRNILLVEQVSCVDQQYERFEGNIMLKIVQWSGIIRGGNHHHSMLLFDVFTTKVVFVVYDCSYKTRFILLYEFYVFTSVIYSCQYSLMFNNFEL